MTKWRKLQAFPHLTGPAVCAKDGSQTHVLMKKETKTKSRGFLSSASIINLTKAAGADKSSTHHCKNTVLSNNMRYPKENRVYV